MEALIPELMVVSLVGDQLHENSHYINSLFSPFNDGNISRHLCLKQDWLLLGIRSPINTS